MVESAPSPFLEREDMHTLAIDLETFSSVDLKKSGVYKYAESDDFEIMLFAYSIDFGDVIVLDLASGEKIPEEIKIAVFEENIIKTAFNGAFERICLSRYFHLEQGQYLPSISWQCTMVWSATLGLPLSLEGVGLVLGLEKQKLNEGKSLISYFCKACSPTKTNGGRTRNLPIHDREKWDKFKEYNKRDVEVEIQIQQKLSRFPVSDMIWEEYRLDQEINDRGIAVDMEFVNNAIKLNEITQGKLTSKMVELTHLENPNSVSQMKTWLSQNGLQMDSLGKNEVAKVLESAPPKLAEVLELRQQVSKSSVKKYTAMQNSVCSDNRVRGMFQFYGANRTGRFSGRLIQLQNLPRNYMSDLAEARELVKDSNFVAIDMLYDNPTSILSELIRTAFIPRTGTKFIVADFSAIEARVIAWLAGETWRLDVFERGGDIYCASASQMFGIVVEKNGMNSHLRQKGKIAELALGYGGSVGALTAMGAIEMGLAEEELKPLVEAWRSSNPKIVQLWWEVDRAVKECVKGRTTTKTHGIRFSYQSGFLFIILPSGRKLSYVKPRIGENRFGGENVTYEGVGCTKKWERIDSYGPKFVENIVQAISRDLLLYAMHTLRNCSIVAHIHDEVVIECEGQMSLEDVCEQMSKTPPWAEGLLLNAEGFSCEFYKKE